MPDTVTANYSFVKPEISGSASTWGAKLNADMDAIDAKLKSLDWLTAGNGSVANGDLFGFMDVSAGNAVKKFTFQDMADALNTRLLVPVTNGGTGGTTPAEAREGLALGTMATKAADDYALRVRTISSGTGLSGGGSLAADRTLALNLGGLTDYTDISSWAGATRVILWNTTEGNARVTPSAFAEKYGIVQSTRSVLAGNGLTGGGDLGTDVTVRIGTPTSITNSSSNAVTTTSHTHALGFLAAEVYAGTDADYTSYPIGSIIVVQSSGNYARNALVSPKLSSTNTFADSGAGSSVSGTWRARGFINDDAFLAQRVS